MKRVAGRTTIALLLAIILIGGMMLFLGEYLFCAYDWVHFAGSPHVYSGGGIGCGVILDRSGEVLLSALEQREYSQDAELRKATIHWLGDREGYISAPAVSAYSEEIAGYSLINGLYSFAGSGGKATLTLSAQVQKVALEAMGKHRGTVAVYNYKTGEILCAVSTPNYDPDDVPEISADSEAYEGIYLNRFTQVSYVPGSIFKVVTAGAALEEFGEDAMSLTFSCKSKYKVGGSYVTCSKSHGTISLKTALAKSCNCYFAQLVQELGGDALARYVGKFQVAEPLIFDGITTRKGNFNIDNVPGIEIAWSGIGQSVDLVNPARFLTFVGAIANGGEGAMPYVVARVKTDGRTAYKAETTTTGSLMSAETAEQLTEMMRNNVKTVYGDSNFHGMEVCAKSGTAEVGKDEDPNATFIGFVRDEEYPLAFICVVENGGAGAKRCVPIVSKVLAACKNLMDQE